MADRPSDPTAIVVVSGLPRSGTSMMMRMLAAGGLEPYSDAIRSADEDNPRGYYEHERVKSLADSSAWLADARGKAVKVVSALLEHLPRDEHRYAVVFMNRALQEVLASQRAMLLRRGRPVDRVEDERMAQLFARHLEKTRSLIASRPDMRVLYVEHATAVAAPVTVAAHVNAFLGGRLDEAAMSAAVEPALHRQRS
jgi:hypothetical protein